MAVAAPDRLQVYKLCLARWVLQRWIPKAGYQIRPRLRAKPGFQLTVSILGHLLQGSGPTAKARAPVLLHLTPWPAKAFWGDRALRLGNEGVGRTCRSEDEYVERSRLIFGDSRAQVVNIEGAEGYQISTVRPLLESRSRIRKVPTAHTFSQQALQSTLTADP